MDDDFSSWKTLLGTLGFLLANWQTGTELSFQKTRNKAHTSSGAKNVCDFLPKISHARFTTAGLGSSILRCAAPNYLRVCNCWLILGLRVSETSHPGFRTANWSPQGPTLNGLAI